jgi:hypothetical protein
MKRALQPSYQQAAAGQTPSCVVFVDAMLKQNTGGKYSFPPLGANGTAADLLRMAQNNQLPGTAYTPIATAVKSGQIKPGDVLIWQPNITSDNAGHVAYVTAVSGNQVTVQQRDFSTPQTRQEYPSPADQGRWLDTETFDVSHPGKIAGVISVQ